MAWVCLVSRIRVNLSATAPEAPAATETGLRQHHTSGTRGAHHDVGDRPFPCAFCGSRSSHGCSHTVWKLSAPS